MQPLFDFYYYAVWCYDPVGQPDDYLRPALGWCSLRPRHGRSALFDGRDNPGHRRSYDAATVWEGISSGLK